MEKDIILQKFFEYDRWVAAIEKGVFKDIRRKDLIELTSIKERERMLSAICAGKYDIAPPHTAKIPKNEIDPVTKKMKYRTVYCNEPKDRIFLTIANDLLFELTPEMIHPSCKSYQKGIGCGMVVQEVSHIVTESDGSTIGFKSDLSKYFDSVPRHFIHAAFDRVEERYGHSLIIDVLRKYYDSDWYYDTEARQFVNAFQSLKQGCAVAAWLADVIIYHIDQKLSSLGGFYRRYSDDMIYLGPNYNDAMDILRSELQEMQMQLNPKKVEYIDRNHWVKFLGFSIKGSLISLSGSRIKSFQYEIESRTIRKRDTNLRDALSSVLRYLYVGNGEFSWATQVLPIVNVKSDIDELNSFVLECLRGVHTGKKKIGGLGYVKTNPISCIVRSLGRNVKANHTKLKVVPGYTTISCMQNALLTSRALYNSLVTNMNA